MFFYAYEKFPLLVLFIHLSTLLVLLFHHYRQLQPTKVCGGCGAVLLNKLEHINCIKKAFCKLSIPNSNGGKNRSFGYFFLSNPKDR
jgi:hypothetical protein